MGLDISLGIEKWLVPNFVNTLCDQKLFIGKFI